MIRKYFDHAFASIPAEEFLPLFEGRFFASSQSMLVKTSALVNSAREQLWLNLGCFNLGVFSAERIKHNANQLVHAYS